MKMCLYFVRVILVSIRFLTSKFEVKIPRAPPFDVRMELGMWSVLGCCLP